MLRVATAQFETGKDTDRVLADILRLADEAAAGGARLVHFQECCNYPTSYTDREHAWREAVTLEGPLVSAIRAKAREHGLFIGFNAAVRGPFPKAWMVNHLIGPDGEYIGSNKKQVLMWIERDAFFPSDEDGRVYDTEIGRIGMISCMDGLVPETSRTMACLGADIVLNSLCSNGVDEANLHIPARAAENGYFMISANRVGDMVKGQDLQDLIDAAGMTRDFVKGAGESQVVGPDGAALVRATHDDIGLVFADIDLSKLEREDRMARRRPELYALMGADNAALAVLAEGRAPAGKVALTTIVPGGATFDERLAQAREMIASAPAGLAVLPEFFAWDRGDDTRLDEATAALVEAAAEARTYLVAGLPGREHGKRVNRAVLFGPEGVIGEYRQIHADPGSNDMALGDDLPVFDLPFGRLGLLLGEDLLFPEAARVLARKGADLIACPATWREDWHHELMLTARSAENHVTIVSASRADSLCAKPGTICTTPPEYRFPQTKEVNAPDRHMVPSLTGAFTVEVDLAPNRDKRLMGATDLIMDTRPELYGAILALRESVPA